MRAQEHIIRARKEILEDMDGVEVIGTLNATAFFQTLAAIISARDYGVELSLKSCEKADRWTSIVHRIRQVEGGAVAQ